MSLLKLTSHLCNISKHHFGRLQIRNLQLTSPLFSVTDYKPEKDFPEIDHDEYGKLKTIYKFPYMTHTQFIFNVKYYIPILYVPLWITESVAYYVGDFTASDAMLWNFFKVVFLVKCLLFNKWFTNLVGFMYLTEDDQLVVSHANFKGSRIDEKFAKGELILETNKRKILDKLYVILHCKATGRKFKLNLRMAEMNEFEMIEYFGPLPSSAF